MAAHERLERLKVACLRRRDEEPITGLDYHRIAEVKRSTASGGRDAQGPAPFSSRADVDQASWTRSRAPTSRPPGLLARSRGHR